MVSAAGRERGGAVIDRAEREVTAPFLRELAADRDRRAGIRSDPRLEAGTALAMAFVSLLILSAVFAESRSLFPAHSQLPTRLGLALVSVLVAVIAWRSRPAAAVASGALAWLFFEGFVVNGAGVLNWHGTADAIRLAVLLGCSGVATVVRARRVTLQRESDLTWAEISAGITGFTPAP